MSKPLLERDLEPWRIVLAVIFPPLAVLDKGCGTATLVFVLTIFGWFPGVIAAIFISLSNQSSGEKARVGDEGYVTRHQGSFSTGARFVEVPRYAPHADEAEKRKGAFIRLEDGAVAEVIEDDEETPDEDKRLRG